MSNKVKKNRRASKAKGKRGGEARRFKRIVKILEVLPEYPAYTTAWSLSVRFYEELRTIQRDLVLIESMFPDHVLHNKYISPHGWSSAPGKREAFLAWSKP